MPKRNPYPGVYQLPGGGYRYMVREPQPDGTERQRWYSLNAAGERYSSRREAHEARIAHLARIANPTPQWSSESLGAYLETWQRGRRNWGASSRNHYRSMIRVRILPHLGHIPLRDLTAIDIEAWHVTLDEAGYAATTINATHFVLSAALTDAVEREMLSRNVAQRVTPPRPTTSIPEPWLPDQVRAFLSVSDQHHNAAVWRLLLSTGMRSGELLGMRWRDIDWQGRQVTIQRTITRNERGQRIVGDTTKTSASRRVIPLTDLTLTLLRRHQDRQAFVRRVAGDTWQDDDLVVCSRRGTRLDPGTLPAQLKRIAAAAGVPTIRLHDLRHTAATLMLVRGTPVHVVARILGHSDPATTLKRYSHYVPAYGRDAVDDLERLYAAT